jgi:hypothetical protein
MLFVGLASTGVPVKQSAAIAPEGNVSAASAALGECKTASNPNPLSFRSFCASDGKCWPSMYLLGVQKAATTSVAETLESCGVSAFGLPTRDTVHFPAGQECDVPYESCKETLHNPLDLATELGQQQFRGLYSLNSCGTGKPGGAYAPSGVSIHACQNARFLSATPDLFVKDGTLFSAIPHQLRSQARFVAILREPVARMLSWYNHLRADPPPIARAGVAQLSSFEEFSIQQWHEYQQTAGDLNSFGRGFYSSTLNQFHGSDLGLTRKQLLVLNFDQLVTYPAEGLRQITTHFGLPILTAHAELPQKNTHEGDLKVVSIKCQTRDYVHQKYVADLETVYRQLARDIETGMAPAVETSFPKFDVSLTVHCRDDLETSLAEARMDTSLVDHLEERLLHQRIAEYDDVKDPARQ